MTDPRDSVNETSFGERNFATNGDTQCCNGRRPLSTSHRMQQLSSMRSGGGTLTASNSLIFFNSLNEWIVEKVKSLMELATCLSTGRQSPGDQAQKSTTSQNTKMRGYFKITQFHSDVDRVFQGVLCQFLSHNKVRLPKSD